MPRRRSTLGRIVAWIVAPRSFRSSATRPGVDWRRAQPGGAPRFGPRTFIGHDVRGRGAWAHRDPLRTPRWWRLSHWGALLGWAGLTAGAGYVSWRRHGGREALFGRSDEEGARPADSPTTPPRDLFQGR